MEINYNYFKNADLNGKLEVAIVNALGTYACMILDL